MYPQGTIPKIAENRSKVIHWQAIMIIIITLDKNVFILLFFGVGNFFISARTELSNSIVTPI